MPPKRKSIDHCTIAVKVIPGAAKDGIDGWKEDRLCIRIRCVPEKGKANAYLLSFLAHTLDLPKSNFTIIAGETTRLKRIKIEGISEKVLHERF